MKKDEVKMGRHYSAKVSDRPTVVRIDAENPRGGWDATNVATGKKVRIKSAQRLRGTASAPKAARGGAGSGATDATTSAAGADTGQQGGKGGKRGGGPKRTKKKLTKKERDALRGQHKADQENARARDERDASADGMTASERAMAESEKDKPAAKPRKKREGMSCLDAAAKVLGESDRPLNTQEMVSAMFGRGYWHSEAPTPRATLYSALLREIQKKGSDARFVKVERGKFALAGGGEG